MMVHAHDMICDCYSPLEHTITQIFQKEPELKFTAPEKDLIRKCLTGENGDVTATDHDGDVLEEGLLDAIFKEDFGDGDTEG